MNTQLEKQIDETMKKAFWDLLKNDLNKEPQQFDHLIILIEEIREIIKSFTPNRKDLATELDETLDDSFLKHLFIEKSLDPTHFFKLIMFLITKVKSYSAPYLDEDIQIWEEQIVEKLKVEIVYADFIPFFFKKLFFFLNLIENDIRKYFEVKNI